MENYSCPLTPEQLAGLACDEEVESRIVRELSQAPYWQCDYGPFSEADFLALPDSHWTLLVQECNKYHTDLALLLDRFNFIPNWRVDDVMVSFAPKHGSVGPHLDQYDVFLIQAMGKRRWQINSKVYAPEDFYANIDLHILKSFEAEDEWIVEPGDILYLPPGVSHYGVALEDCITISVGFRAPTYADLLSAYLEQVIRHINRQGELRYTDPDLELQRYSGEITAQTLEKISATLQTQFQQVPKDRWFAELVTEPANDPLPEPAPCSPQHFLQELAQSGKLYRSEYSRFAFMDLPSNRELVIDGNGIPIDREQLKLARLICNQRCYRHNELEPYLNMDNTFSLLLHLYNSGKVYFDDDDTET